LYPDALETLTRLRLAGLKLAIVTARPFSAAVIQHGLESLGVVNLVQVIVTSGDLSVRKPHPALFETAALLLGVSPGATAMVGDSYPDDIVPAAALGMTTIMKLNAAPAYGHWPEAHHLIGELRELLSLECLSLQRDDFTAADHDPVVDASEQR
jgi:putative hydrolase of the HAD superfamily